MADVRNFLTTHRWPAGLETVIADSTKRTAFRFIVVDNSRSMLNRDSEDVVTDGIRTKIYNDFYRWDEVTASVRVIAGLARSANAPTEIRLLNNPQSITIGSINDKGDEVAKITSQLSLEPSGQTPICSQLFEITKQLRNMEVELRKSNRDALLVILTDGKSTDGDIIDALRPLEGYPIHIIIRVYTEEQEILDYWQDVNSKLNLDICILKSLRQTAAACGKKNSWLTYGENLHLLREFGVDIPGMNELSHKELSRTDIKNILQLLLEHPSIIDSNEIEKAEGHEGNIFMDPTLPWDAFLLLARELTENSAKVLCPVSLEFESCVRFERLQDRRIDPLDLIMEKNEHTFWRLYLSYALTPDPTPTLVPALPSQDYRAASAASRITEITLDSTLKYGKNLMEKQRLWTLFTDLGFVPLIVNTKRFDRIVEEINPKCKISFYDFLRIIVRISDLAFPRKTPLKRMVKMMNVMNRSDAVARLDSGVKIEEEGRDEEIGGMGMLGDRYSEGERRVSGTESGTKQGGRVWDKDSGTRFLLLSPAELLVSSSLPPTQLHTQPHSQSVPTPTATPTPTQVPSSLSISLPTYTFNPDYNNPEEPEGPWSVLKERSRSPKDGFLFSPPSNERGTVSHLGGKTLQSYFNHRSELWGDSNEGGCKEGDTEGMSVELGGNIAGQGQREGEGGKILKKFSSDEWKDDEDNETLQKNAMKKVSHLLELAERRTVERADDRVPSQDSIDTEEYERLGFLPQSPSEKSFSKETLGGVEAMKEEVEWMGGMRLEDEVGVGGWDRGHGVGVEGGGGASRQDGDGDWKGGDAVAVADVEEMMAMKDLVSGQAYNDIVEEHRGQEEEEDISAEDDQTTTSANDGEFELDDFLQPLLPPRSSVPHPVPPTLMPPKDAIPPPVWGDRRANKPFGSDISPISTATTSSSSSCSVLDITSQSEAPTPTLPPALSLDRIEMLEDTMYPSPTSPSESYFNILSQSVALAVEEERRLSVRLEADQRLRVMNTKDEKERRRSILSAEADDMQRCVISGEWVTSSSVRSDREIYSTEKRRPLSVRFDLREDDNRHRSSSSSRGRGCMKANRREETPTCLTWVRKRFRAVKRFVTDPILFS